MSDHPAVQGTCASDLAEALMQTLAGIADQCKTDRLAVAYSGGLDSSVLLDAAAVFCARRKLHLLALHVHHGLSQNADHWLAHCRRQCQRLGIAFEAEHVVLEGIAESGVEEAARLARYAALGRMCRAHGVPVLLTAHHLDDQAETVLLQLLRGSGLPGMSGMDAAGVAPGLLGDASTIIVRPLLGLARAQLERYAVERKLSPIEDESNADLRYTRNALRHLVMPALQQSFPGFQYRLARAAGHAQGAQVLLQEVALEDLARCRQEDHLSMPALRALSEQRFFNLMRYWFGLRGMRMPSAAWMREMREQLLSADQEAQLCVSHPDGEVHRYRERVFLSPRRRAPEPDDAIILQWHGETSLTIAAYYGVLHVERLAADDVRPGIDARWLSMQELTIRGRSGGERIRLASNRPARSLKQHFQSADIPAWKRPFLPLLFAGDELVFAAGIGMDCTHFSAGGERVHLRWQAD